MKPITALHRAQATHPGWPMASAVGNANSIRERTRNGVVTVPVLLIPLFAAAVSCGEVRDDDAIVIDGNWAREYASRSVVKQGDSLAAGRIVSPDVSGKLGAWRCVVEPGPNAKVTGIVVLADQDGNGGLECVMGGTGEMRGLTLRGPDGKTLWQDAYAPWMDYEPCIVEVVVEAGRVRAQLLDVEGTRLISQSDWVEVPKQLTAKPGLMGLVADKGIGRFWDWTIAPEPLAAITPDAPNKRRIVPGDEWAIVGPMVWQWKTGKKEWLRQPTNTDRAWAMNKKITGSHRQWSCRVKVSPPAGGAGLAFQASADAKNGFLAWLGGTYGNGCLILYDLSKANYRGAIWSGPQGKWKYDTEYVLVGESKPGHVRARMLAADGKTVISESPWKKYNASATDRTGMMGFHTWKGPAEFGGFQGAAKQATGQAHASATGTPSPQSLGLGWTGDRTTWQWTDPHTRVELRHSGEELTTAINASIKGIHGTWRCTVKSRHACRQVDLLFHVSADGEQGFAASLAMDGGMATLRLINLGEGNKVLASAKPIPALSRVGYVLEGISTTDRVRARVRTVDGKTILADTGEMYVSDRHNTRTGHLGVRGAGSVHVYNGSFTPE